MVWRWKLVKLCSIELDFNDELHIHCKIEYETKKTVVTGSRISNTEENLANRFEKLFNCGMEFSDVQIHAGKAVFPAHKVVLASGSPVLGAMFQSKGFSENKSNMVKIEDFEPAVVKEILRFLYTDQVKKMKEFAKDLLVAADKYMINLLKSQCQSFLSESINIHNCCELLALADSHLATELKKVAMEFILQRVAEVATTDGWKEVQQSHPHLGFQLVESHIYPVSQPKLVTHELPKTSLTSGKQYYNLFF